MGNTLQKPQLKQNELTGPPENQTGDSIFTCQICIEPVSNKFRNKILCAHPFCVDCVIRYIQVKLEDNVSQIPCPALHCDNIFDPLSLQPLLSPTVFTKWCDLLCDSTLLGVERCYCPYRNCSALVIDECGGGDVRKVKCPNCKRLFCFRCRMTWHAGFRCEESREMRDGNDVAFGVLAERNRWMRCPRCRHFVERVEGCKIMKCRCDTSFCYRCGKPVRRHLCGCDKASMCCIWCLRISTAIMCFFAVFISFFWFNMVYGRGR